MFLEKFLSSPCNTATQADDWSDPDLATVFGEDNARLAGGGETASGQRNPQGFPVPGSWSSHGVYIMLFLLYSPASRCLGEVAGDTGGAGCGGRSTGGPGRGGARQHTAEGASRVCPAPPGTITNIIYAAPSTG